MTRPSFIAFTSEVKPGAGTLIPKIVLRNIIYSTGKRGYVIEVMYVYLRWGMLACSSVG
jgi:hypothetical protein